MHVAPLLCSQTNIVFPFRECYNKGGCLGERIMGQLGRNVLAPLTLRLGLALFFAFQGLSKLGPDNGWGSAWHEDSPPAAQAAIAWTELLGAALLAFGFLTRLFALLLGGTLVAALFIVHGAEG